MMKWTLSIGLISSNCCSTYVVVINRLLHQRGRSSKVLCATHMVAHEAREFNDESFDNLWIPLTYDAFQISSSPCNMYQYEDFDYCSMTTGEDVFLNHNSMTKSYEPDFTGNRVKSYRNFSKLASDVNLLVNVFSRSEECFKGIPDYINSETLDVMRSICATSTVKTLQKQCHRFKWDGVMAWNPDAARVTKSMMLGVVGIDEGSSEGAMTCVLDLLLKYGEIKEEPDGSWSRVKAVRPRRYMCYGDRTTNENMTAFIVSLQDRPMSLQEESIQADIFIEAVANTQDICCVVIRDQLFSDSHHLSV